LPPADVAIGVMKVDEAIVGRRAGDQIDVDTPRRRMRFDLVSVDPLGAQLATAA
jgi:hypothetical protein